MLRVTLQLGELLNFVLQTSLSVCLRFQPAEQQYASDQSNHREVFAAWLRNICFLQGSHWPVCRSAWLGLLAIIFPVTAIKLQQPFTASWESLFFFPHGWLLPDSCRPVSRLVWLGPRSLDPVKLPKYWTSYQTSLVVKAALSQQAKDRNVTNTTDGTDFTDWLVTLHHRRVWLCWAVCRMMICALFIYSLSIRHGSIHLILTYFWKICRDGEVKIANIGNVWKSRMFSILSLHSWDSQAVSFDGFSHAALHLVLSWCWWWLPSNKSISFKCSVHVEMWRLQSLSHFILINYFSEPSWPNCEMKPLQLGQKHINQWTCSDLQRFFRHKRTKSHWRHCLAFLKGSKAEVFN